MSAACIGVRVARLHRLVVREFEQGLRPLGLSLSQLEILSTLLALPGPTRPTVLADQLGVERSTMSRNLTLLVERGWVRAAAVSRSGRSLSVAITDLGLSTLAGADAAWTRSQAALLERLGPESVATLDGWVGAMGRPRPGGSGA